MTDHDLALHPWRVGTKYWTGPHDYDGIDQGIRFAVRVLHARGYETCQSCEGGEGHAYDHPTIDLIVGDDAVGFAAAAELAAYGLRPESVAQHWRLDALGRPYETIWRIVLAKPVPERADDPIMFIWGYQSQPVSPESEKQ